jgi:anti-sigma28 factor (negative regulator of flagellin synthesis)
VSFADNRNVGREEMEIGPLSNNRALTPEIENYGDGAQQNQKSEERANRYDSVEISGQARQRLAEARGRALAGGLFAADATRDRTKPAGRRDQSSIKRPSDGRRRERIEEFRNRIQSGYYELPQVKQDIVNRLIDKLDF